MLLPNAADYRDCGMPRVLAAFRESMRDSIEDRLPRLCVPTVVIRGERDAIVPQAWAEEVTCLLPQARLVTVMAHRTWSHSPRRRNWRRLPRFLRETMLAA